MLPGVRICWNESLDLVPCNFHFCISIYIKYTLFLLFFWIWRNIDWQNFEYVRKHQPVMLETANLPLLLTQELFSSQRGCGTKFIRIQQRLGVLPPNWVPKNDCSKRSDFVICKKVFPGAKDISSIANKNLYWIGSMVKWTRQHPSYSPYKSARKKSRYELVRVFRSRVEWLIFVVILISLMFSSIFVSWRKSVFHDKWLL